MKNKIPLVLLLIVFSSHVMAKDYEECYEESNENTELSAKIEAIPKRDLNKTLRGIVAGADYQIETFSECLPDPRAVDMVEQYNKTRKQAMRTCSQLSYTNCDVSPF